MAGTTLTQGLPPVGYMHSTPQFVQRSIMDNARCSFGHYGVVRVESQTYQGLCFVSGISQVRSRSRLRLRSRLLRWTASDGSDDDGV
jgi:hypothetical protein